MNLLVPVQQIKLVKKKDMSRHGRMNTILDYLNTSETFLILNSIRKTFHGTYKHETTQDLGIINNSS